MKHPIILTLLVICCIPISGCIQSPAQVKQETPMLIKNATESININVTDISNLPQKATESFDIPLPTVNKTKLNETRSEVLEEIEDYLH